MSAIDDHELSSLRAAGDGELSSLRAAGDLAGLADALGRRGARALDAGDWPAAIRLLGEASVVAETMQRPGHAAQASIGVAIALRCCARLDEARRSAARAV